MSVYIIAELGSVPDSSLGNALRLIEECAKAGANAAKLQDHLGERIKGDPPWFRPGHETRAEYLRRTEFTDDMWRHIRATCTALGVDLVVSPFSVEAVERLERIGVDAYKVASGQVTNLPMLEAIAKTGKRAILSSGMTTRLETWNAALKLRPWAILGCTSAYPCDPERVGLNFMRDWGDAERIQWRPDELQYFTGIDRVCFEVGLSDHTLGFAASLAAITLGATVIERHVCFDRRQYGSDAAHSLTLDEFARFCREVRELERMLENPVSKDELAASPELIAMREAFLERPEEQT